MDKYLLDILKEMNTIIIPGLGALTITNNATGEIMFMPYLKFDDGKLARYIAEKEGWSENDAHNLIAKYVREIEAKLNVGDTYDMYRFGSFTKNSSGDIEFNRWKDSDLSVEETNYVEPALGSEVIEETKTETAPEGDRELTAEAEPDPEQAELDHADIAQEAPKEKEDVIIAEEAQVTEYVADPDTTETKFNLYTEEDQWNDDLDLPPINAKKVERPKKPILEKTQKDKKRRPIMAIAMIAGVLLIGGTLTIAMFYNSLSTVVKEKFAENKTVKSEDRFKEQPDLEPSVPEPELSSPAIDQEGIEQAESPETDNAPVSGMIQTSTGQVDPARPYHLIAGAFSVRENADRFKSKLREIGNSNAEIIGQFDGLYMVSAGSYSSNEEALRATKENTTISRSWIFRWP